MKGGPGLWLLFVQQTCSFWSSHCLRTLARISILTLRVNCFCPSIFLYLLMSPPAKKRKKQTNEKSQITGHSLCNIPKQSLVPFRLKCRQNQCWWVTFKTFSPESFSDCGHLRGRHPEKFQRTHVVSSENTMQIFSNAFLTMVFPLYSLPQRMMFPYLLIFRKKKKWRISSFWLGLKIL